MAIFLDSEDYARKVVASIYNELSIPTGAKVILESRGPYAALGIDDIEREAVIIAFPSVDSLKVWAGAFHNKAYNMGYEQGCSVAKSRLQESARKLWKDISGVEL